MRKPPYYLSVVVLFFSINQSAFLCTICLGSYHSFSERKISVLIDTIYLFGLFLVLSGDVSHRNNIC